MKQYNLYISPNPCRVMKPADMPSCLEGGGKE